MANRTEFLQGRRLDLLPSRARVAFAARCARLVQPLVKQNWPEIPQEYLDILDGTIHVAELFADGGSGFPRSDAERVSDEARRVSEVASAAAWAAFGAGMAAYHASAIRTSKLSANSSTETAIAAVSAAPGHAQLQQAVRRSFDLLYEASQQSKWTYETCIPASFFALRSEFEVDAPVNRQSIINISSVIDGRLMAYFAEHPEKLYDLQPRQFEELIAELFSGFGFQVRLTAKTRDGGSDIIAVQHDPAELRLLIECKRYAAHRTVGVAAVRALHGVVTSGKATKGILATTARFTAPAQLFMEENRWLLEGRDLEGLLEWLDLYQTFRIGKLLGVGP